MLKIARSMSELPFEQLMEVYKETNMRSAERHWGKDSPAYGLTMAEKLFYEQLQCGFYSIPDAMYCLWFEDEQCVSALRLEPWKDGWLLAALETAPAHRKRGYAQALLTAVQGYLMAQGAVRLYSHISHRNVASIRVHQRCGFKKIADTARLLDGTVTSQMGTYRYDESTPEVK